MGWSCKFLEENLAKEPRSDVEYMGELEVKGGDQKEEIPGRKTKWEVRKEKNASSVSNPSHYGVAIGMGGKRVGCREIL